jgi:hypothetical protein
VKNEKLVSKSVMIRCDKDLPDGVQILQMRGAGSEAVLKEACSIEKKSFPKHMSMKESLEREVRKPRACLLYILDPREGGKEIAGFALLACEGTVGQIAKIVVRDRSRRMGFGEALMKVFDAGIVKDNLDTICRDIHGECKIEVLIPFFSKRCSETFSCAVCL